MGSQRANALGILSDRDRAIQRSMMAPNVGMAVLSTLSLLARKHPAGFFKTDAVLALVGEVLGLVPPEPDSCNDYRVTTNM